MINIHTKIFAYFTEIHYTRNAGLIRNFIMNILNLLQRFPDEASCIVYPNEQMEQTGIVCKHRAARNIAGIPANQSSSADTATTNHYTQKRSWSTASCLPSPNSLYIPANLHHKILFHRKNPLPLRSQTLPTHLENSLQVSGCHGKK